MRQSRQEELKSDIGVGAVFLVGMTLAGLGAAASAVLQFATGKTMDGIWLTVLALFLLVMAAGLAVMIRSLRRELEP